MGRAVSWQIEGSLIEREERVIADPTPTFICTISLIVFIITHLIRSSGIYFSFVSPILLKFKGFVFTYCSFSYPKKYVRWISYPFLFSFIALLWGSGWVLMVLVVGSFFLFFLMCVFCCIGYPFLMYVFFF